MLVSKKEVLQPEVNEDKDNKENNINTKTTTIANSTSAPHTNTSEHRRYKPKASKPEPDGLSD